MFPFNRRGRHETTHIAVTIDLGESTRSLLERLIEAVTNHEAQKKIDQLTKQIRSSTDIVEGAIDQSKGE